MLIFFNALSPISRVFEILFSQYVLNLIMDVTFCNAINISLEKNNKLEHLFLVSTNKDLWRHNKE